MSHDHSSHTHETAHEEPKSKTGLSSAFWLTVIIAGLFIASLNFMKAMSADEGSGHGGHDSHEAAAPTHVEGKTHEGTSTEGTATPTQNVQHDATVHPTEAPHKEAEASH